MQRRLSFQEPDKFKSFGWQWRSHLSFKMLTADALLSTIIIQADTVISVIGPTGADR